MIIAYTAMWLTIIVLLFVSVVSLGRTHRRRDEGKELGPWYDEQLDYYKIARLELEIFGRIYENPDSTYNQGAQEGWRIYDRTYKRDPELVNRIIQEYGPDWYDREGP
jgi:hypothetical protein